MKMVRSLLLGTAAALVAGTAAQAADLPVKAKPVQYVRICDLYGAGFYYMPGTEICIKIGGFVRAQYYVNSGPAVFGGYLGAAGLNVNQQANQLDTNFRARTVATIDTRQATDYGTLRTYLLIGFTQDSVQDGGQLPALYATRAFIQWAGFTMGKAVSFYDAYSNPYFSYYAYPGSDTGDAGKNLFAYTWQLGNGVSATLSLEDPRRLTTVNTNVSGTAAFLTAPGAVIANNAADFSWPDIVGAVRLDQAWGSLQFMGALHDASASYYVPAAVGGGLGVVSGSPGSEVGFAVGVGGMIRASAISPGDMFGFQINYAEGATRYVNYTQSGIGGIAYYDGGSITLGHFTDSTYGGTIAAGTASGVELTKAFGFNLGYDHVWSPNWQTSVYGGYNSFDFNTNATALICGAIAVANRPTTCDPDFSLWFVGTRTQWNVTKDFYMGVDFLYTHISSAHAGTVNLPVNGPRPAGVYNIDDQDVFQLTFRAQRSFLP